MEEEIEKGKAKVGGDGEEGRRRGKERIGERGNKKGIAVRLEFQGLVKIESNIERETRE
jgi:hypothetical protein